MAGGGITIPSGPAGSTVRFDDATLTLRIEGGAIRLGDLTLASTDAPIAPPLMGLTVPVIVLAGQSNAQIPPIDNRIVERLTASGNAFEFVSVAEGGTSLFANSANDWDPASTGELTDRLIEEINAAIANVEAQGHIAQVTLLWVQGEADVGRTATDYLARFTAFVADVRTGIGEPSAEVVIASLPFDSNVRTAQFNAAATLDGVDIIDTRGVTTFDGVHYDEGSGYRIAEQFLSLVQPAAPAVPGYNNLLAPAVIAASGTGVVIEAALYEDFTYHAPDDRNHRITSHQGADHIVTGAGNDQIFTRGNADYIDAGAGADTIDTGNGDDTIFGGAGTDFILGRFGNDFIDGGADGDIIAGGDQNDVIFGGGGDDLLIGEAGQDTLAGGQGIDTFRYDRASDSSVALPDLIEDFAGGVDKIDLKALGTLSFIGAAAFGNVAGQVRYAFAGGGTTISADLNGDGAADFAIQLTGQVALAAADFVL